MGALTLADWSAVGLTVLTLVILEGLLSADNALVLAVMVRHLPKAQQKRALRYGIAGAFIFRFIAIIFAATLLKYWQFEVIGGLYLLYIAASNLVGSGHELGHAEGASARPRVGRGFWATVAGVELADIAFSIDSILAAVAMAQSLPERIQDVEVMTIALPGLRPLDLTMKLAIVYTGGVLGIITMRIVAGYFIILLDRFKGLAIGAYVLVGWIGLKLVGSGLHEMLHPEDVSAGASWRAALPDWVALLPLKMNYGVFWGGMVLILILSMLYRPRRS